MKLAQKQTTLLLAGVALIATTGVATAQPAYRHVAAKVANEAVAPGDGANRAERDPNFAPYPVQDGRPAVKQAAHASAVEDANVVSSSLFGSDLVTEARRYIGTNPTDRRTLWCGAFVDLVLRRTGHKGGGLNAPAYANYGTRLSGPRIGAIAVMSGHVGIVSGIDASGNPIIVSGNHRSTVDEVVFPRRMIVAYVQP